MHPILIDLGTVGSTHLFLPTYGVLFALGVLLAWGWFARRARTLGLDAEPVFNLTFYTLLAGLIGAKLTLLAVDWQYYLSNPKQILGTIRAAGVLMGGVLLAALAFAAYSRRKGLPTWSLADAIAAPLALAQGIGRLGCFAAGCCYGVPAGGRHWWSVVFTDPAAAEQTGVPLHVELVPTQLLQAANDLLLAVVLTWLWRKRVRPDGTVFWVYVLLYCLARGTIEFWRGDTQRGLYFGELISTSQVLSLAGAALAIAMLVVRGLGARREAVG